MWVALEMTLLHIFARGSGFALWILPGTVFLGNRIIPEVDELLMVTEN
jgi:hypothetical protein